MNYKKKIFIIIFIIIFIVFFISNNDITSSFENRNNIQKSQLTANNFQIINHYNNKEYAHQLLMDIDKNIIKLINAFNSKYTNISNINICKKQKKLLTSIKHKLNKTYKSSSLQENFPTIVAKEVSYNVDKGKIISICLRNYENPDTFHNLNELMFVAIHEIAHSCNESYGHDTKFWKVFRILLEVAVENNIYTNINYQKQVKNYCSMSISYNPIFDRSLDDIEYFKN